MRRDMFGQPVQTHTAATVAASAALLVSLAVGGAWLGHSDGQPSDMQTVPSPSSHMDLMDLAKAREDALRKAESDAAIANVGKKDDRPLPCGVDRRSLLGADGMAALGTMNDAGCGARWYCVDVDDPRVIWPVDRYVVVNVRVINTQEVALDLHKVRP